MLTRMSESTPIPAHGVRDLRAKVVRHLEELASEALDNESVDLGMAARISDALLSLVAAMPDLDDSSRMSIRGAVDYFVLNRDELPDIDSRVGLVDDAQLVNKTCDEVGLPDLKIRIG